VRLTPNGLAAFESYREEMTALLKTTRSSRRAMGRPISVAHQKA